MKTFLVISALFVAGFTTSACEKLNTESRPVASIQGRIFGGNIAEPHQFPYQVGLNLTRIPPNGAKPVRSWCGGSLISKEFVLTAAHCLQGVSKGVVLLGVHNIKQEEADRKTIFVSSENFFIHPKFNTKISTNNDVALIKLPSPVELNDFVQTIRLPRPTMVQVYLEDEMVVMTGWGQIRDDLGASSELRYANLRVLPQRTCAENYRQYYSSQICVSGNVQSVCRGDSGGPLVAKESDGTDVVVGVTSFIRKEGCEKGFPTVFTRVTSFLDWISHTTGIKMGY